MTRAGNVEVDKIVACQGVDVVFRRNKIIDRAQRLNRNARAAY